MLEGKFVIKCDAEGCTASAESDWVTVFGTIPVFMANECSEIAHTLLSVSRAKDWIMYYDQVEQCTEWYCVDHWSEAQDSDGASLGVDQRGKRI